MTGDQVSAFVERHFRELALFVLLLLLVMSHAFMMHWNRPPEMIHWMEALISSVATALITLLSAGPREPKEPKT